MAVCTMVGALCALAFEYQAYAKNPALRDDFPRYCQARVEITPTENGARAGHKNFYPMIFIDPDELKNRPWVTFLVAHECAHHELGHTSARGKAQRQLGGVHDQELRADCWAAARVPPTAALAAEIHFSEEQGERRGAPGYPTGKERAETIRQCGSRQAAAP